MDLFKMCPRNLLPKIFSIFLILLALTLNQTNGKPLNINPTNETQPSSIKPIIKHDPLETSASFQEGSAERTKRQLFRGQIPHHRPLSGNLYAHHHGYPHPGRWHANPQQIIRPNYNSGLHFDNPNVIITDEDFNRYGSTLQHIDDHRIQNNPQPILHQYPTEFAKIVPLDRGANAGHDLPPPLEVPIVAMHHHIHHGGGGNIGGTPQPFNPGPTYEHVSHGHTVVHPPSGNDYSEGPSHGNLYSQGPTAGSMYNQGPTVESYGHSYSEGHSEGPSGGGGGSYNQGHDPGHSISTYPSHQPPKSSKPFFGFKLHQLLGQKPFGGHSLFKGFLPGGLRSRGSGVYKRRHGAISWTEVDQKH